MARSISSSTAQRRLLQTPGPSGAPNDGDDGPNKKFNNRKKGICNLINIAMTIEDLEDSVPGALEGKTGKDGNAMLSLLKKALPSLNFFNIKNVYVYIYLTEIQENRVVDSMLFPVFPSLSLSIACSALVVTVNPVLECIE